MATAVDQSERRPPEEGGWSWRRLLVYSTIGVIVGIVVILILSGLIPPLIVFAVIFIVGLFLLRSKQKAGAITLLVASVLFFGLNLPFILPVLAVPASAIDFSLTIYLVILNIVAIVSAIALIRKRDEVPSRTPRLLGSTAVALIVIAIAISVVATVTYDTEEAQGGDITLVAEGIEWAKESLSADEGTVTVFVDNNDLTLHTFTIDELDVDVDIPAGKSTRVTFEAEQGAYTYYCVPHESQMEGIIDVR